MLLNAFKTLCDNGYVIVPKIKDCGVYLEFCYGQLTEAEGTAWRLVLTIPEVRRAHLKRPSEYVKLLNEAGIRCAKAGTPEADILRHEFKMKPLSRRDK